MLKNVYLILIWYFSKISVFTTRHKSINTEEYQDFERRMLDGKKEEREGMKAKIFNMERNAPQFLYFCPVDDWRPEPPEPPKAVETEQSKSEAETKPKPLPHEQRSRPWLRVNL